MLAATTKYSSAINASHHGQSSTINQNVVPTPPKSNNKPRGMINQQLIYGIFDNSSRFISWVKIDLLYYCYHILQVSRKSLVNFAEQILEAFNNNKLQMRATKRKQKQLLITMLQEELLFQNQKIVNKNFKHMKSK